MQNNPGSPDRAQQEKKVEYRKRDQSARTSMQSTGEQSYRSASAAGYPSNARQSRTPTNAPSNTPQPRTPTNAPSNAPTRRSQSGGRDVSDPFKRRPTPNGESKDSVKAQKRKEAKKKMLTKNLVSVLAALVIVCSISAVIAGVVISCVNDILVLHKSEEDEQLVTVVIDEDMNTRQVLDRLDEAGVIKNAWFCNIFAKFVGYSDDGYLSGTYELSRSMGVENMLNSIKNNLSNRARTVTLTFPEGLRTDQIIDMLDENQVCDREDFVEAMNGTDFTREFDFLLTAQNFDSRYNRLEGYLFPDTYEFYLGEDPVSVIRKFLNNFSEKWTSEYAETAQEMGLTVDRVVKLASIIQAESYEEDMPVVSSILHNRLDAGMRLDCDSTTNYISYAVGLTQAQVDEYAALYDTYVCDSYPLGAICNPGAEAIHAVLNPADTDYYYFIHDANNTFRVARTLTEHENNIQNYGVAQ